MTDGIQIAIISGFGALMLAGIGWLIAGQRIIATDAKHGRKILHDKIDAMEKDFYDKLGEMYKVIGGIGMDLAGLKAEHKINHGG